MGLVEKVIHGVRKAPVTSLRHETSNGHVDGRKVGDYVAKGGIGVTFALMIRNLTYKQVNVVAEALVCVVVHRVVIIDSHFVGVVIQGLKIDEGDIPSTFREKKFYAVAHLHIDGGITLGPFTASALLAALALLTLALLALVLA